MKNKGRPLINPNMDKRGQMEIPFQLIFSLILIAAFIYAAGIGIKYFLATAELAKVNKFIVDFQGDVEQAWLTASEVDSEVHEYSLPSRIKYVCFNSPRNLTKESLNLLSSRDGITDCTDFEYYISAFNDPAKSLNMFFCPAEGARKIKAPNYAAVSCRNRDCLEFAKSPYCIKNIGGKVSITLNKEYGAAKMQIS